MLGGRHEEGLRRSAAGVWVRPRTGALETASGSFPARGSGEPLLRRLCAAPDGDWPPRARARLASPARHLRTLQNPDCPRTTRGSTNGTEIGAMKAAIYARKSTEQNDVNDADKSVTRQVALAKAFAAEKSWLVTDDHVYVDDAVSGVL